ncbi:MAG: hypothetical protein HQ592_15445 [Planctomycetes bacterium]|nr:hypothetical protein [Planctomycetota bacterium]
MPIDFPKSRWEKIREDSRRWWAGELKRPLIQVCLSGADPGRPEPKLPSVPQMSFYDMSVPAENIIDLCDYQLSKERFLGDAFPATFANFGPGVVAAFMGARVQTEAESTWFGPVEEREIADLRFEYDPDNVWLKRVKDVTRAAVERWDGQAMISMTDLGGNLDILSSFRPGEKLLFDLCDHPEAVKKQTWEAHEMWWRYFEEINEVLQPANPGYTAWARIFSTVPSYMLQCDFCYMIGPDMFDEFVRPELQATCKRLGNAFYHLDGPGQLPHLDSLLTIPELKGVQWVPGSGAPGEEHWPEVYRKIRDAGKLIQLFGGIPSLDAVSEQLGSAEGIVAMAGGQYDDSTQDEIEEVLKRYDVI